MKAHSVELKLKLAIPAHNEKHARQRIRELLQGSEALVNYGGAGEVGSPMIIAWPYEVEIISIKDVLDETYSERSSIDTEKESPENPFQFGP